MVPSGVSLSLARKTQDGFRAVLGGRTDLPGSDAVQGRRGRHRLPHLGKEGHRVLVADTVRDDRPVERLLLAEHRRPTLVLAPRAHDRHDRLLVLPRSCHPLSRRRRPVTIGPFPQATWGRSSAAQGKAACAVRLEALLIGGGSAPGSSSNPAGRAIEARKQWEDWMARLW